MATGSGAGTGATRLSQQPVTQEDDDENAWGDFEEASPSSQQPAVSRPGPAMYPQSNAAPAFSQPPARNRVVRASTMDLVTNTLISLGDGPSAFNSSPSVSKPTATALTRQPWRTPEPAPPPKAKKPADPNVLFDAEDYDGNESFDEDDDDDEFGDFETVDVPPAPAKAASSFRPPQPPPKLITRPNATPAAATALVDLLSLDDPEPSPPSLPMQTASKPAPRPGYSAPLKATKNQHAALLSPLAFGATSSAPVVSTSSLSLTSPSFRERSPYPGLTVTTPTSTEFPTEKVRNRTPSPVTDWPSFDSASASTAAAGIKSDKVDLTSEDAWDAWQTTEPVDVPQTPEKKPVSDPARKSELAASEWDWDPEEPRQSPGTTSLPPAITKTTTKTIPEKAPPPTNVPPPSILLSLFPQLIALPNDALFKPIATQPTDVRNRVIGDPKTIAFLRNYLQIIVVAGRVVAGRKQRWHRDKFLSQSMSISAAGSSKGGGMKLAGLDKAQGQREDREAADVVDIWLRHVGKLRTAVATANSALVAAEAAEHKHYPPLRIPELQSATITVTAAKNVPTAVRPCVICGLRRDERVRGIDGDDVQDIFGEWWVEHWGHRDCRNFWAEHETALRSR